MVWRYRDRLELLADPLGIADSRWRLSYHPGDGRSAG